MSTGIWLNFGRYCYKHKHNMATIRSPLCVKCQWNTNNTNRYKGETRHELNIMTNCRPLPHRRSLEDFPSSRRFRRETVWQITFPKGLTMNSEYVERWQQCAREDCAHYTYGSANNKRTTADEAKK